MAKLTLLDIVSGYAVVSTYNTNNTSIETAIENTLSRDGTAPNAMAAVLDMGSNQINNVADGSLSTDAVNLRQLQATTGTAAAFPSQTGNANKVLKTDGTVVAWVSPQTIADSNTPAGNIAATTIQTAINELDTDKAKVAGDAAQNFAINDLSVAGTAAVGGDLSTEGTFSSTKACAAGYTRVGPNLCMKTTAYSATASLTRDVVAALSDPSADSTALIVALDIAARSGNSAPVRRTASVDCYGDATGTVSQLTPVADGTEQVAMSGNAVIARTVQQVCIVKDTGYSLKLSDDAGNNGTASYEIRGYYD
jgi:hypothetical protein